MKCEEVEELIIDYLDKKLDAARTSDIEKHLESCERCLDEMMEIQEIMNGISRDEMIQPDDNLRINFYNMLHNEIRKDEIRRSDVSGSSSIRWYNWDIYRIAAGLALLICGTFIGMFLSSGLKNKAQALQQLQSEVTSLRKSAIFTMLKEESSSNRIQGVSYANDLGTPDENVIGALMQTLNYDKNVNVRLAAAYALSKFADQHSVCDSLVKSLSLQTDPILQITLINILVERNEKSALKLIRQIMANKGTIDEVKAVAEGGARKLML